MKRFSTDTARRQLLVLLTVAVPALPFLRGEGETPPAGEAEVARLIKQLGDDQFQRREAAAKRLDELGPVAWEPLRRAAAHSDDAEIRIRSRDLAKRIAKRLFAEVRRFEGHKGQVSTLALSADGKRLLSGGLDATIRVWSVETGKELHQVAGLKGSVWGLALSRDGKLAYFSVGMNIIPNLTPATDFTIQVWDTEQDKIVRRLVGHTAEIKSIVLSPDGRTLISGGRDMTVRAWDVESGKELLCFKGHTDAVRRVALTPDGQRVLSAGKDRTVRTWDIKSAKELSRFTGHSDEILGVAVTPDGRQALSVGADKVVRHWDIATGKELRGLRGHTTVLWSIGVSPRGRLAVSGGGSAPGGDGLYVGANTDFEPRLGDLATGEEIHVLAGPTNTTMSAVFAPDGRHLFTASSDGSIRMWRTDWPAGK
jgi:WD40 repeat protein